MIATGGAPTLSSSSLKNATDLRRKSDDIEEIRVTDA